MINPVRFPTSSPQALPEPAETRPNLAAADRVNPLPGGKWRTLRHSWRPTGRHGPLFARGQRAGPASRRTAPRPRKARPHRRPGNRRARRGCAGGGDRFRCRRADGSARTARAGPRLEPTARAGPHGPDRTGRTTAWAPDRRSRTAGPDYGLDRTAGARSRLEPNHGLDRTAGPGPPGPGGPNCPGRRLRPPRQAADGSRRGCLAGRVAAPTDRATADEAPCFQEVGVTRA